MGARDSKRVTSWYCSVVQGTSTPSAPLHQESTACATIPRTPTQRTLRRRNQRQTSETLTPNTREASWDMIDDNLTLDGQVRQMYTRNSRRRAARSARRPSRGPATPAYGAVASYDHQVVDGGVHRWPEVPRQPHPDVDAQRVPGRRRLQWRRRGCSAGQRGCRLLRCDWP